MTELYQRPTNVGLRRIASWLPLALLLAGSLIYLIAWPRDLYLDEGLLLYGAKRVLGGDVPYRDFFDLVTPAGFYFMAALFSVFGTSMATARVAMAVLQTAVTLIVYATCRALGVRRELAAVAGAAHVVLFFPALSIASPHWMSTALLLLTQLVCVHRVWVRRSSAAIIVGLLIGAQIAVQQQRGAIIAAGGAVVLLVDHLLSQRFRSGGPRLAAVLGWYAAGVLALVGPMTVALVIAAGVRPVFEALILFPFFNYRGVNRTTWGAHVWRVPYPTNLATLLRWLPLLLPLPLLRAAVDVLERRGEREARQLSVMTVLAFFSVLSIIYKPDYIHLALVGPMFAILAAETLEWCLGWLGARTGRVAGWAAVTLLLVALAPYLYGNIVQRRALYHLSHQTAFGRVDFRNPDEAVVIDRVRELMSDAPSQELFCYPSCAGMYLNTDTTNPTPYQQLIVGYNGPEQFQQVLDILEQRRVPYVLMVSSFWLKWKTDPIARYVTEKYERVNLPLKGRPFAAFSLFKRRSDGDRPPGGTDQELPG